MGQRVRARLTDGDLDPRSSGRCARRRDLRCLRLRPPVGTAWQRRRHHVGPAWPTLQLGLGREPAVVAGDMRSGDRLLRHTDGVLEAPDPPGSPSTSWNSSALWHRAARRGAGPRPGAAGRSYLGGVLGNDLALLVNDATRPCRRSARLGRRHEDLQHAAGQQAAASSARPRPTSSTRGPVTRLRSPSSSAAGSPAWRSARCSCRRLGTWRSPSPVRRSGTCGRINAGTQQAQRRQSSSGTSGYFGRSRTRTAPGSDPLDPATGAG
jgi:hypothetical protein